MINQKMKAVVLALLRKNKSISYGFYFLLFLNLSAQAQTPPSVNNDANSSKEPKCLSIRPQSLKEGYPFLGTAFNDTLKSFLKGLQANDAASLAPLFHPRLKIKIGQIKAIMAQYNTTLQKPLEISMHQLWELRSPEERAQLSSCGEDGIKIYTLYGYSSQFAAWIQLLGVKELGRIFIHLIPVEKRWLIGSFHYEVWTHTGKSFEEWSQLGLSNVQKNPMLAYMQLDLAAKLTRASDYFVLEKENEIKGLRDRILSKTEWEQKIRSFLSPANVRYISTLLLPDGLGILVRITVANELSLVDLQKECNKLWTNLKATKQVDGIKGLRCNFLLPNESPNQDGQMIFALSKD